MSGKGHPLAAPSGYRASGLVQRWPPCDTHSPSPYGHRSGIVGKWLVKTFSRDSAFGCVRYGRQWACPKTGLQTCADWIEPILEE